ncbi:uncharacterized protein LOC133177440 [Saccostrea echinata]|uniref:uncharacterized protein LOC133177440 n=1 Tax=Saccostrea echinata TaxID=191078 RepID=UPI002A80B752|nr:uncharacterized protein LOC133177440 [Saccostrea echinata]
MENTKVMIMEEIKVLKEDVFREISNEFFIQDKIKEEIKMTVSLKVKSFEYEMTQKMVLFTDHLLGHRWDQLWKTPKDESLGSTFLKEILDRHISQCKVVLIRPSNTARAHSTQSHVLSVNETYTRLIPREIESIPKSSTSSFIDEENAVSPNSMDIISEPLEMPTNQMQPSYDIVDSNFKVSNQVELTTEKKNSAHISRPFKTLRSYPRRHLAKKETDVLNLIDDSNFMVKYINDEIGNGVFARKKFSKGEPLLEYKGKLREGPFLEDEDDTYFFEFNFNGKLKIIDASVDDGSLGRLINDEHCHPNIFPKLVEKGEKQHIIFKAKKDIEVEDEIRFNYGGESFQPGHPHGFGMEAPEQID